MSPMSNRRERIPVIEIFGPTIQGEGALAGKKTHFIRTGGCGYRCEWCDTMYAVDPRLVKQNATLMHPTDILWKIYDRAPAQWITLSGGDPCMHDLGPLVKALKSQGYQIAVETQGQLCPYWLALCDLVTVSPKPPSSGMAHRVDWSVLGRYKEIRPLSEFRAQIVCKIVVFDSQDYDWARQFFIDAAEMGLDFDGRYLSVGTLPLKFEEGDEPTEQEMTELSRRRICDSMMWLFEKVSEDSMMPPDIVVLPQLHTLAWGQKRGV
jgi:7-carboxy-7-deazaguanine synthase